jgi:alpha-tubulin suppressor-like RCC1 family protein
MCAIVEKRVWCWGSNFCGELGRDFDASAIVSACSNNKAPFDYHAAPVTVLPDVDFIAVTGGVGYTCAVRADDGTVYCFGFGVDANAAKVGDAYQVLRENVPGQPLANVEQIVGAASRTCARDHDGRVFCWGDNAAYSLFNQPPATQRWGAYEVVLRP